MSLWQVRTGRGTGREQEALDKELVIVGWEDLPDLTNIKSKEELVVLCQKTYPKKNTRTIHSWANQIWTLVTRIKLGDLVIVPLKSRSSFAIGKIEGTYQYRTDLPSNAHHTRGVKWIRKDIPRSAFDKDILLTLGSILSVCQIQRNHAEERIQAMLSLV